MKPIPMVLHCPKCHTQHIDVPEPEKGWTNPPHKSHLCHSCGTVWRPADVPTTGVAAIATRGKQDTHPQSATSKAIDELLQQLGPDGEGYFGWQAFDPLKAGIEKLTAQLKIERDETLAKLEENQRDRDMWEGKQANTSNTCHALKKEISEALAILAPSMPKSGLVDAARQVKQVAISEKDNAEKLDKLNTHLIQWSQQSVPLLIEAGKLIAGEVSQCESPGRHDAFCRCRSTNVGRKLMVMVSAIQQRTSDKRTVHGLLVDVGSATGWKTGCGEPVEQVPPGPHYVTANGKEAASPNGLLVNCPRCNSQ